MKCFWIFNHNWSRWTKPFQGYDGTCTQYRECKDCGRVKSRIAPFQYGGKKGSKAVNEEISDFDSVEYEISKIIEQNRTTQEKQND